MNKLEMAHEYVMNYMASPDCKDTTISNIVSVAWSYADLMQAEADKRQNNTTIASHVESNEYYPHYQVGRDYPPDAYVMYEGKKTLAVSISNEWQPDWSQAPRGDVIGWKMKTKEQAIWLSQDGGYYLAPSFDYQGNWQDSLRKRPQ